MKITIIGAGNVGKALGAGWAKAGHQITYGSRTPTDDKSRALIAEQPKATVAAIADAAHSAEVVVFTTPWPATEAAIRDCGSLSGKIVIDVSNPVKVDLSGLSCGFDTSAGEQVAQWATGAQVFKTMNQIGFMMMDHPEFKGGVKPVMFVAGDGDAKPKVMQLVSDLGFEAVDAGGIQQSRQLESLAMLWIQLAVVKGLGPGFGFGLLRK